GGRGGQAGERAHRDRVVSAEDDRQLLLRDRVADERRDVLADLLDRPEVAVGRAARVDRLRDGRAHVAPVGDVEPQLADTRLEACVPDRRGPHIDAATTWTEVQPRTDDGDRLRDKWRGPDLNRRHHGFQPCALPTELPRQRALRWTVRPEA